MVFDDTDVVLFIFPLCHFNQMPTVYLNPIPIPSDVSYTRQQVNGFQRYFYVHYRVLVRRTKEAGEDCYEAVTSEFLMMKRDLEDPVKIWGITRSEKAFILKIIEITVKEVTVKLQQGAFN